MLLSGITHRIGRRAGPYKADNRAPEKSSEHTADVHAPIASSSREMPTKGAVQRGNMRSGKSVPPMRLVLRTGRREKRANTGDDSPRANVLNLQTEERVASKDDPAKYN